MLVFSKNKLIQTLFNFQLTNFLIISLTTITSIILSSEYSSATLMDEIKSDMQQLHEVALLNYPTNKRKGGAIQMGSAARGDATPTFWTPDNSIYKTPTPWETITPWFVFWPAVDHSAKNTRVKVSGIFVSILEKDTGTWKKLDLGAGNPNPSCTSYD